MAISFHGPMLHLEWKGTRKICLLIGNPRLSSFLQGGGQVSTFKIRMGAVPRRKPEACLTQIWMGTGEMVVDFSLRLTEPFVKSIKKPLSCVYTLTLGKRLCLFRYWLSVKQCVLFHFLYIYKYCVRDQFAVLYRFFSRNVFIITQCFYGS